MIILQSTCWLGILIVLVSQSASAIPVDEDFDTLSIDVTTITAEDVEVTSTTPFTSTTTTQNEEVRIVGENESVKNQEVPSYCKTARGMMGHCTPVSSCYSLLLPENGTVTVRNRVLAEMLIEVSGFCDTKTRAVQARSDISEEVVGRILRSEILLCCPEFTNPPISPESFKLDDIDPEHDVYDEMFKAKGCGYKGTKELQDNPSENECEQDPPPANCSRIVKGRKTKPGEYPWVVAMMNKGRQFCGGALINQNTVISAAHCVQHMTATDVKNMKLLIGDYDIYKKGEARHEVRGAKAVKYHKGFSMRHLQHDISLIILDKPVEYRDNIQAVCLHTGMPNVADGKSKADVAGWGALSEGGGQPSDLRAVTVRVLTNSECAQRYSGTKIKLGDGMICAGADKGEDSCQGDSGGPLTVDNKSKQAKEIGIVSFGIGCGRYPGVYTAVYKYLNWINQNMVRDMGYE